MSRRPTKPRRAATWVTLQVRRRKAFPGGLGQCVDYQQVAETKLLLYLKFFLILDWDILQTHSDSRGEKRRNKMSRVSIQYEWNKIFATPKFIMWFCWVVQRLKDGKFDEVVNTLRFYSSIYVQPSAWYHTYKGVVLTDACSIIAYATVALFLRYDRDFNISYDNLNSSVLQLAY